MASESTAAVEASKRKLNRFTVEGRREVDGAVFGDVANGCTKGEESVGGSRGIIFVGEGSDSEAKADGGKSSGENSKRSGPCKE